MRVATAGFSIGVGIIALFFVSFTVSGYTIFRFAKLLTDHTPRSTSVQGKALVAEFGEELRKKSILVPKAARTLASAPERAGKADFSRDHALPNSVVDDRSFAPSVSDFIDDRKNSEAVNELYQVLGKSTPAAVIAAIAASRNESTRGAVRMAEAELGTQPLESLEALENAAKILESTGGSDADRHAVTELINGVQIYFGPPFDE